MNVYLWQCYPPVSSVRGPEAQFRKGEAIRDTGHLTYWYPVFLTALGRSLTILLYALSALRS